MSSYPLSTQGDNDRSRKRDQLMPSPSPEVVRDYLKKHDITSSAAARIVAIPGRTMRRYCTDDTNKPMPYQVWALLRLLMNEATPAAIRREIANDADDDTDGRNPYEPSDEG